MNNAAPQRLRWREVITTISLPLLMSFAIALLVYVLVGSIGIAAIVGGFDLAIKLILFCFNERIWKRIHFRKQQQYTFVLWFTGLPCSGKSTLADLTYHYLLERKLKVERLDGDAVRSVLPETGFTREDRNAHIRRIGYLSSILEKNGITVIASFVSPYRNARRHVRAMCKNFIEVFVEASVEECEKRDTKGLYARARAGEISNFTGINDPYEAPENPELTVNTDRETQDESFAKVKKLIQRSMKN